jgi:hypothetical protein
MPSSWPDLFRPSTSLQKSPRGSVVTANAAGRPPIDQKLRIFARTFVAPFQSVAPFWRIFLAVKHAKRKIGIAVRPNAGFAALV